jgi:DNA mismatch endonuclease Vsr
MRTVRTRGTEPEKILAIALTESGLRFSRNDGRVFGKPDLCFTALRLAVFVDGDFWHGRAWFEHRVSPATNPEFWVRKFEINRKRDKTVDRELRRNRWSVLRLWGSDVRRDPIEAARRVQSRLTRLARQRKREPDLRRSRRGRRQLSPRVRRTLGRISAAEVLRDGLGDDFREPTWQRVTDLPCNALDA